MFSVELFKTKRNSHTKNQKPKKRQIQHLHTIHQIKNKKHNNNQIKKKE